MTDEPLVEVFKILNRLQIAYMLTGSYASNIYGRIRSTFDADLVVTIHSKAMRELVKALSPGFYVDSSTLAEAREAGDQFNAVHKQSGLKIDFYLLPPGEYSQEAFSRRRSQRLFGQDIFVIAPEDLILAKLQWAKRGASGRQIEDARGVYQLQKERLDMGYLRTWAESLSVVDSMEQLTA